MRISQGRLTWTSQLEHATRKGRGREGPIVEYADGARRAPIVTVTEIQRLHFGQGGEERRNKQSKLL